MTLDVGSTAPDFTLTSQDRQTVSLRDYRKAFHDTRPCTFPLLSGFNKQAIGGYGVFDGDTIGINGIAKRAVFVLDRHGVVRHQQVLDDARNEPDSGRCTMRSERSPDHGALPPGTLQSCLVRYILHI